MRPLPVPSSLVRHEPELRALAARLVEGDDEVEELLQETWVATLRRWPQLPVPTLTWLKEVLRGKARVLRRREERWREAVVLDPDAAAELPERVPPADERTRLEALYEELVRLREPYGSTLRRRFLEGVPPRRIAAEEGLLVRTVHTRITRGLRMLRERMDRRQDARRRARGLLARLLPSVARVPGRALVASALVAAGALALLALARIPRVHGGARGDALTAPRASARDARTPLAAAGQSGRQDAARDATGAARAPVGVPAAAPEELLAFAGRVLDLQGRPVAGAPVVFERGLRTVRPFSGNAYTFEPLEPARLADRTDAEGRFRIELAREAQGRLSARVAGTLPVVFELVPNPPLGRELVLLVAEPRSLRGRVREGELPVAGARVVVRPPLESLSSDRPSWSWEPCTFEATSDAQGRFALEAPRVEGAVVVVEAQGFRAERVPVGPGELDLVLERELARPALAIRGTVVEPDGAPSLGAVVVAGTAQAWTRADGSFELRLEDAAPPAELWAVQTGRLPARLALDALRRPDGSLDPGPLVLSLGGPALAIGGRVVRADGAPAAGVEVWALDPTVIGERMESWWAEQYMNPVGRQNVPFTATTADDGSFELGPLCDRPYRLGFLDEPRMQGGAAGPFEAGARDVLLRLPPGSSTGPLSGRVFDRDGRPVEGAFVTPRYLQLAVPFPEGRTFVSSALGGPSATTGPEGWYDLPPIGRAGVRLAVSGNGFLDEVVELGDVPPGEQLDVVLPRRTLFRATWRGPRPGPTHLVLLDPAGRPLRLDPVREAEERHMLARVGERVPLEDGRSPLLFAPDTAAWLVWLSGERELERLPVRLAADAPNEL